MRIVGSLGARLRGRRGDAAVMAVIAAFFTLMFAGQIFGGKFLLAGDPLYYSYPLRTVGWGMIRAGHLPLWTPSVLSGYPLLSMSQLAFAYPLTWGYLFLPGHWAEHLYVLAPFLLSPAFTYAYARETGRSRPAALLAGLAFGYGGMMCSGISFAGLPTNSMLWLPLALIPVDRAATGRGRFVPLLVGATAAYAMSVLNGQGQSFLYTGIVVAAYGLYVSLFPPGRVARAEGGEASSDGGGAIAGGGTAGRPGWRGLHRWRPLFVALGALLMSAGLAAFQILETMRAARRSIRSTLSYEAISAGAFTFKEAAASIVMPLYYATDVSAYVPPLALVFAALACFTGLARLAGRRGEEGDTRLYFWLGVAVVGWVLMLGPNTPAQQIVYRLPLLNKFRVPSRHTFEWTFAAAILAAYGWDAAARRGWLARPAGAARGRRGAGFEAAAVVLLLVLCVAVGVYWWRAMQVGALPGTYDYTGLPEPTFLSLKLVFTLGVLLLVWRSARLASPRARAGFLMAAIAIACFVEPSAGISRWFAGMLLTEERFRVVSPTTRFLQNYPPAENRVYTRVELYSEEFTHTPHLEAPNLTALHGIQNVAGYEPLIFERYSRALGGVGMDSASPREGYASNDHLFQERSHVLDLLNATFVVSFANLALAPQSLIHRDGVAFFASDTQAPLGPGETVTLGGGEGAGDTLALVTSLSNAVETEQGAAVARVRVHFADSPAVERELRAGVDTAEWAHERPDVRRAVRHALAPVFDARPGDAQNSYPAHRYLALVPLGARGPVDKIEITNLTGRSTLALWKTSLHDSAGKTSVPIPAIPPGRWEVVYQQERALILRNRRALPRAWLVAEAEAVDGEEALRRISGEGARDFDPRRTALLEVAPAELPALPGGEPAPGSGARVAEYEPNRLVIETRAAAAAVLVVSEMFYPGWEATVDGRPAHIHNTNFLLRGVVLPAGDHRVEMHYRAPAARRGALISFLTLLGLGVLTFHALMRRSGRALGNLKRPAESAMREAAAPAESAVREAVAPADDARAEESRPAPPARPLFSAESARLLARELCVFAAFALLTVVMTWPWAHHWRDTVSDLGDPYSVAYTLWWDYHATFNQPTRIFDATIFYPYRDTLAFSEHDYGIALLFFPLYAAGVAPLTVYSLATMLAFTLSGYGAFRLGRTLTGSAAAGLVAGIAFAFVPYRFHRLPHLHYIFAGWLPLAFEALVLFARQRSWRRASWLGAAFTMNALTCITWFILSLIPLALSGLLLVLWARAWRDPRLWLRGGLALGLSAVLLLPFLLPYRRVAERHGFVRGAEEVTRFSATLNHWFAASARNKLWDGMGRNVATDEVALFPGLLAPLLALASLLFFVRRGGRRDRDDATEAWAGGEAPGDAADEEVAARARADGDSRRGRWLAVVLALLDAAAVVSILSALMAATYGTYSVELFGVKLLKASHYGRALVLAAMALALRWVLSRTDLFRVLKARGLAAFARPGLRGQSLMLALAWAAPGLLGSFGMNFIFHRLLFEHVELFRSVRVPARWAMIAYVGMAVLAGLGAGQLAEFVERRNARLGRRAVVGLLAALLVAELWAAPLSVTRGHALPDALTLKLRETPMRGGVVNLPVWGAGSQNYDHMLRAADHGKPLVTAASSFMPPLVHQIHTLSRQRPAPPELLDVLESVPASYLVLDYSQMALDEIDSIRPLVRHALDSGRLRFCGRFDDRGTKDLFAVVKTEPEARAAAGEYTPPRVRLKLDEKPGGEAVVGLSLTPEFAEGGTVLHRFYKASYGRAPSYAEFRRDLPLLTGGVEFTSEGWRQRLAEGAERFAAGWVEREEFGKLYGPMDDKQYVAALAANAGQGVFDRARRRQLAAELTAGEETRAGALLRVVGDEEFARRESDFAFVLMHYFSFLEREPDAEGLRDWTKALRDIDRQTLTRLFTSSIEYQRKRRERQ